MHFYKNEPQNSMATEEVIFKELVGNSRTLGQVILNRPQALNALSYDIIKAMEVKLQAWEQDPNIAAILLTANGDKAFCAGGDIRALYHGARDDFVKTFKFFKEEYGFNYYLKQYAKPYISILNGLTLGGGAGISLHGSHAIATEKLKLGMPETAIGLYPDVGASYFLSRCSGGIGKYLGLTGNIIGFADAVYTGLIKYTINSQNISLLIDNLLNDNLSIDDIINKIAITINTDDSEIKKHHELINQYFKFNTVEEIMRNLQQAKLPWCDKVLEILLTRCPTSLKVTNQQLILAKDLNFAECMQMEYRITKKMLKDPNLYEGIRAVVIDKTRDPKWQPDKVELVSDEYIQDIFKPTPEDELEI